MSGGRGDPSGGGTEATADADGGPEAATVADDGPEPAATADDGQKSVATADGGQKPTAAADDGQKPAERAAAADDGQKLTAADDDGPEPAGGPWVAALDVGTTSVRCVVLDKRLERRGVCRRPVQLLYPQPEHVEIDPDQLFSAVCEVIRGAIKDAGLTADQITTLGISTQRSSFTTWSKETGKCYHNIVCWSDRRASSLVKSWNSSLLFRVPAYACRLLHLVTRNPRFLAVSVLRLMNQQVTMRLLWCMQNVPALKADIAREQALFGTVETFLLYRLTAGRLHVSDCTNAAATGFFDPYLMRWSGYPRFLFGVAPASMLPAVVENTFDFGRTEPALLGAAVPIGCVVGDQSASLLGAGCTRQGDVAVTLGTGSFMDVNTGGRPHTSVRGLYPAVGWQHGERLVFMAEGSAGDTANTVLWGRRLGLYGRVEESAALAASVPDAGGVSFVPAFSGLAAPVNDFKAAAGFIGVTPATTPAHLTRALLQAVAFRLRQLHDSMQAEAAFPLGRVTVAGGVANNDLVCQLAADVLGVPLRRPADVETSVRGAAALAGLAADVWRSEEEVVALGRLGREFRPDPDAGARLRAQMADWERALARFGGWYADDVK